MLDSLDLHKDQAIDFSETYRILFERSEGLTKDVILKNAIGPELTRDLLQYSNEAHAQVCLLKSFEYGFRVFINNDQKNPIFIRNNIFTDPPSKDQTPWDWQEQLFGDTSICYILNNVEAFSEEVSQFMSKLLFPAIDDVGMPLNGLHSTLVYGNYGYTPLGIHHDVEGSFTITIHLGPAPKKMYLWDWDHFISLGGKQNEQDVEKFLPEARVHEMEPGDIFFMPWNKAHVGYSDQFSLSLTNWFDFYAAERLMRQIINSIALSTVAKKNFVTSPVSEHNYKEKFEEVISRFDFEDNLQDLSLVDNIKIAQEKRMQGILSNGGYFSHSLTLEDSDGYDLMEYDQFRGKTVVAVKPYVMRHMKIGEKVHLFIRGHAIQYAYDPAIEQALDRLNTYVPCNVDELMENRPEEWNEESFLYFLSNVYNYRGINILNG